MVSIVVADDHKIVREGLIRLLEAREDFSVVGEASNGEEAVALALYCVLKYPDDYVACIRRGANSDGDSDSIASISGGIMGAKLGLDAIPEDWRKRCENTHYIGDLAHRMAQAR